MDIHVDTAALTRAGENIPEACERLLSFKDRLDQVHDWLKDGTDGDNCGFDNFRDRWAEECRIIGEDRLPGAETGLTSCAEAFDTLDNEIAKALTPVEWTPMPTDGPVAV